MHTLPWLWHCEVLCTYSDGAGVLGIFQLFFECVVFKMHCFHASNLMITSSHILSTMEAYLLFASKLRAHFKTFFLLFGFENETQALHGASSIWQFFFLVKWCVLPPSRLCWLGWSRHHLFVSIPCNESNRWVINASLVTQYDHGLFLQY